MKIWIKDSDNKDTVLANGPKREIDSHVGPSGLAKSCPRLAQRQSFLRGVSGKTRDRGNQSTAQTFSVSVEKASIQAAEHYFNTYAIALPREGTIYMESDDGSGNKKTTIIPDAMIEDVQIAQRGVTVDIGYTISGGKEEEA